MRNMLIATTISLLATGCVSNGLSLTKHTDTPANIEDVIYKNFIGIPTLLSMEGSSVYLGDGWYITASHNENIFSAQGIELIKHDVCDVALFRDRSHITTTKISNVELTEVVFTAGYLLMAGFVSNKGVYIGDMYEPNNPCLYSTTSSSVTSGMSGGGVWDTNGKLVGIIRGVVYGDVMWENGFTAKDVTVFTKLQYVKDWIYEHTNIEVEE